MWLLLATFALFLPSETLQLDAAPTTPRPMPRCPDGYQLLSTEFKCVKLYTNPKSHYGANNQCVNDGGFLVSISNAIDNRAVTQFASSVTTFMIGLQCNLTKNPSSCFWDDQSGDAKKYNAFARGYPVVEVGKCVYSPTSGSQAGSWLSGDCDQTWAFVCETAPIGPDASCSNFFNGYCYEPSLAPLTASDAELACQQKCGHLVSIQSYGENDFVQSLPDAQGSTYIRIGLKYNATINDQFWTDGTPYDFNYIGYSNPRFGSCYSMALKNDVVPAGEWTNSPCDTPAPYICKRQNGYQCVPTTFAPPTCNRPFFYYNKGTFYSPGYPSSYGAQTPCIYVLSNQYYYYYKMQIRFPVLDLDPQSSISLYTSIEDTVPLAVITSEHPLNGWYTAPNNTMVVRFQPCTSGCPTSGGPYRWEADFKSY